MLAPATDRPPRLFVVCPVYRDAPAFTELRGRVRQVLSGRNAPGELRFVVTDDTAGEDAELAAMRDGQTAVLVPPYNLGHQGAIVYALRELAPTLRPDDVVVTMDSDGEDRPEDLPALLAPLLERREDLLLVSVARRTSRQESFAFRVSYLAFKAVFRLLTGVVIRSGNFAAMRGALVVAAIGHPCFDQCYSSSLISLPFRRRDVPLARGARYSGRSRMGFIRLVTHGMHMLMPFLDRIAVRCLLASAVVGAAAAASLVTILTAADVAPLWSPGVAVTLLVSAGFGVFAALTLFATASRSRAQSVRVLHSEQILGRRMPTTASRDPGDVPVAD